MVRFGINEDESRQIGMGVMESRTATLRENDPGFIEVRKLACQHPTRRIRDNPPREIAVLHGDFLRRSQRQVCSQAISSSLPLSRATCNGVL